MIRKLWQFAGSQRKHIVLYGLLFLKELAFWIFHGVGRLMERITAFHAEINYRRYLLQEVISLGLTWHAEHDSDDTIDKVNKAGAALADFTQEGFQIVMVVIKLLGSSLVLVWFSPLIGFSVFFSVLGAFLVILRFDKYLLPQYQRLNHYSNKASAPLFDALSNISTVKILHKESELGLLANPAVAKLLS